ncbi:MAG: hypothetical protein LBT16_09470, partial [Treponema sp.]|nr:hypothetical protein [Treponema sp.]
MIAPKMSGKLPWRPAELPGGKVKAVIIALYSAALLIVILYVFNGQVAVRQGGNSPFYRDLMDSPAYARIGFELSELSELPDPTTGIWKQFPVDTSSNKTVPLRIMNADLPGMPKRTWLSPIGKSPMEFTILLPVEMSGEAIRYLEENDLVMPGIFLSCIG